MAFVYERIPKEDYHRFSPLGKYRRETLTDGHADWAIDRELDIFIVFLVRRKFVHITEYIDNPGKDFSQPYYDLMCNRGEFFGFEYATEVEITEKGTIEREGSFILHYKDTNIFLRDALRRQEMEYKLLAKKLIHGYFSSRKSSGKRCGPNGEIEIRKKVEIIEPKVTWFSNSELDIL